MSFAPKSLQCGQFNVINMRRRWFFVPALTYAALALVLLSRLALDALAGGSNLSNELAKADHGFRYFNDVVEDVPLSVHVVKIERGRPEFEFRTTLGKGDVLGMSTLTEQLKSLPPHAGQPLAAINGDFYQKDEAYDGRPRDLQLLDGEVVSAPAGHTCFWMDPAGVPHMTNVFSDFRAVWPDGKTILFGLNEARPEDGAVLYTLRVGSSTRTSGGVDLLLEPVTNRASLPLKACQTYHFKVAAMRQGGNAPLSRGTLVLSLGPKLLQRLAPISTGATLLLSTRTIPDCSGVHVAIGGGPALVHRGKPFESSGFLKMRHPRSALGWSKDHIFLVEVDGRQSNISIGMTFRELAEYMVKLGCEEAMNLDGGGSATLWVLGTVRNSPSEGEERPGANTLVLMRKKPPPALAK